MHKLTIDTFLEAAEQFSRIELAVRPQWRSACECSAPGVAAKCQVCPYYKELGLLVQQQIDPLSEKKLAEILPVPHADPYSESVKSQCIEMYLIGYSLQEIQKLNGIPLMRTLRTWLREVGLQKRSAKYSKDEKQTCIHLYIDGWEPKDIEKETGVPADTITDWAYSAGVSRIQKYSDELKQQCLEMYKEGKTAAQVAQAMQVNVGTLRVWIGKAGIGRQQKQYSKEKIDKCLRLYSEGVPPNEISRLTGVLAVTIRSWIRKAGWKDERLDPLAQPNSLRETHERKPSGYWKSFDNLKRELIVLNEKRGKIGAMPTATELKQMDRQDILRAICKHHGGFQAVAEKLKLSFCKRSPKYWHDFSNVEHDLLTFVEHKGTPGVMPTKEELTQAEENSLAAAIASHGGFPKVARQLKLKLSYARKPRGYWKNIDNLKAEIGSVAEQLDNPGVVPTYEELKQVGRPDLISAIADNGGWPAVARKLGFSYARHYNNPNDYFKDEIKKEQKQDEDTQVIFGYDNDSIPLSYLVTDGCSAKDSSG